MENTKKLLRAVLAISLSIFLFVASCYPASAQIDYDLLKRGVVKIIAYKPEDETGAGIVVGVEGNIAFILTALHVVTYQEENQRKEAQKIEVVFFGKPYMKFTGILFERYHEDLDMAVILVYPVQGKTLPSNLPNFILGDVSKLKEGDRVSTIGHPLESEWQPCPNTIIGLSHQSDYEKFCFTKTALDRGLSGGPVFNQQNHLIGMVTSLSPNYAIAVKIDAALLVLRKSWRIPTTNLVHPLAFGTIVVDSKPSGSQVYLDDQPKGSTTPGPLSIDELEAGSYSLRVTKEGYAPWEQSVDVESGKELSIVAQLEPYTDRVKVGTVDAFIRSIKPNTVITLEGGRYNISEVTHIENRYIRWVNNYDGLAPIIHDVSNLIINGESDVEILIEPRYAWVLDFYRCRNIKISNVRIGHTEKGFCMGGVLRFSESEDVEIKDSTLFGSGTYGIELRDVNYFRLIHSTVKGCSYGLLNIANSANIVFRDSIFEGTTGFNLIDISDASRVIRFDNCEIKKNWIDEDPYDLYHLFVVGENCQGVSLERSRIANNRTLKFINSKDRIEMSENTFVGNSFSDYSDQELAKWKNGEDLDY